MLHRTHPEPTPSSFLVGPSLRLALPSPRREGGHEGNEWPGGFEWPGRFECNPTSKYLLTRRLGVVCLVGPSFYGGTVHLSPNFVIIAPMSKLTVRLLLGAMMFFQYAAWGAWAPVLGATLGNPDGIFKANGSLIGAVFGVVWLMCIFVPFIGGQLVDRAIPSQLYMGVSAVVCAGSAWMMSQQTSVGNLLPSLFPIVPTGGLALWLVLWAIAFAPSIGIGNSICLYHLSRETAGKEPSQSTPSPIIPTVLAVALSGILILLNTFTWKFILVGGILLTNVFIAIGISLVVITIYKIIFARDSDEGFSAIRTAGTVGWIAVAFIEGWAKTKFPGIPVVEMAVSAIAALLWAVCAFVLPNMPPAKQGVDPFAFKKAFALFGKVPGFTVFMIISLVASAEFQFFYTLSGQFLGSLGVPEAQIAPYKSTSQMAEVLALAVLLPLFLKKFGMRWTLVIGTLAWSLRYFIFATKIFLPVVASLSLHGIGFAFVFITSYFYIDRIAPKDIRGSAQSLYTLVTLGVGNWLGSILSGKLQDAFTVDKVVNWPLVFIVPALLTLISAIAFFLTFKEPPASEGEEPRAALAH